MKKSTHRGFRGPNNFLLARPIFSSRNRTSFFDAESTDAEASIDRGARTRSKTIEKIIAFAICLPNKIDASRFSVPEQFFFWRALYFHQEIERRFFDAESTDADASIDRGARKRSKTVEKIIAFAICLPTKIDASRFSGPEQFFAGAPYISVQKSNVVFSTPNRSMPMPRSIAVLENDRKRSKKS